MRLDPIVIVPYDPDWPASFARQQLVVETALGAALVRPVEHIGSTAVPGLAAKPIIDMLAVISNVDEFPQGALEPYGWIHAPEPDDVEQRRLSYCLPSVEERTRHLHVVEESFASWQGWVAFRDYLRAHPDATEEYAALKAHLPMPTGTIRTTEPPIEPANQNGSSRSPCWRCPKAGSTRRPPAAEHHSSGRRPVYMTVTKGRFTTPPNSSVAMSSTESRVL